MTVYVNKIWSNTPEPDITTKFVYCQHNLGNGELCSYYSIEMKEGSTSFLKIFFLLYKHLEFCHCFSRAFIDLTFGIYFEVNSHEGLVARRKHKLLARCFHSFHHCLRCVLSTCRLNYISLANCKCLKAKHQFQIYLRFYSNTRLTHSRHSVSIYVSNSLRPHGL